MKSFLKYQKETLWHSVCTFAVLILVYGRYMLTHDFYVDEELFLNNPFSSGIYLTQGRFSIAVTRRLIRVGIYNPYVEGLVTILLSFVALRLLAYILKRLDERFPDVILTVSGLLVVCSTVFQEQYYFKFQAASAALALVLIMVAVTLLLEVWERFSVLKFVAGVLLLIYAFGTYQAFVGVTLTMYLAVLFVSTLVKDSEKTGRKVLLTLAQFVPAFVIYELLVKIFFSSGMGYLSEQINWLSKPFGDNVGTILSYITQVIKGGHVYYSRTYTAGLVLLTLALILSFIMGKRKNLCWRILCFFGLILSPFFLVILLAGFPALRAQMALVLCNGIMIAVSANIIILFVKERFPKFEKAAFCLLTMLSLGLLYLQVLPVMRLFYTHDVVSDHDRMEAARIVERVEALDYEGKPLVFIGCLNAGKNPSCYTFAEATSYLTLSAFELRGGVGENSNYHNSNSIVAYLESLGYKFSYTDPECVKKAAEVAAGMHSWPAAESVADLGFCILVKLSEDAAADLGK